MPKGGRHGNLSAAASRIYEGIRKHTGLSKTSAARIANAKAGGGKRKSGKKK